MTHTVRPADLDRALLEEKLLAPPSAQPLDGDVLVRSRVEFANDERTIISGVWESETGPSRWEFTTRGEIIHVVSGRMIVQRDGEEPVTLTAGDSAYFPIGWSGVWTVVEPVRKFYVVYR